MRISGSRSRLMPSCPVVACSLLARGSVGWKGDTGTEWNLSVIACLRQLREFARSTLYDLTHQCRVLMTRQKRGFWPRLGNALLVIIFLPFVLPLALIA